MTLRRDLLAAIAMAAMTTPANAAGDAAAKDADFLEKALAIHERVLVIDSHLDIPPEFATETDDPLDRPREQADIRRMESGGVDAAFFIVQVGQRARVAAEYSGAAADAFIKFSAIRRMTDELYPDRIGLALTSEDVLRIHRSGKRVALIGIENGFAVGREIGLLDVYYRLGGRYIGLVHNGHNDIGDSALPRPRFGDRAAEYGGLSEFGRAVVERANRLGFMLDVSHAASSTLEDVLAESKAPVIASHSSCRALADDVRNLSDEQLLAIADHGGVVQITAVEDFLREPDPAKVLAVKALDEKFGITYQHLRRYLPEAEMRTFNAARAEIDARWPRATVADLVDHIDHAVRIMGIDHVGIASDFQYGGGVAGWDDFRETPNVTVELLRRGYSEEDTGKIWGGNLLRVMAEVERVAREQAQDR